ncbi:secreted aspartic proteinase precursor [Metarhizium album ARSEF 1941]|uniref:Secreted aspartic proteinase n=1 Tax=Metarhizium album (strain ARSEF 1941) TaxID=1081103 RepID=A0A0B2WLP8_METAS|nr:secreted aspartic proteinase precursor [Metarhizium album ARSEF 1941]KHN94407.1 secreted aspartic proteinase precursor [Metarhizium album ARSEF 1941]
MQTFGALLVSLAAAGLATALPTSNDGQVSVRVARNRSFRAHGPLALAKAYRKFNKPIPDDVAAAVSASQLTKRATGSVTNVPQQYDSEYLAAVQIGTPAQTLDLAFDTGSSELWVLSAETPSGEVQGQTLYHPASSSTARLLGGLRWNITYEDGSSSSGDVYSDVVAVGGLQVKGQAVESAQQVSAEFTGDAASGLLGLAFGSLNTVYPTKQKTFFDNAQASLAAPLFTANLNHDADGKYNFGYIDASEHTGSITYTAVDNSQGLWGFTATGYAVGDDEPNYRPIPGIADTGTSLLLLDDDTVRAYYAQVSGSQYDSSQGGYTFGCGASLPDFTFGVEDSSITIPGAYMNYCPTDDSGSTCFGGIQSSAGIGLNIFGDVALKAALVVFDAGNTRLGWAPK